MRMGAYIGKSLSVKVVECGKKRGGYANSIGLGTKNDAYLKLSTDSTWRLEASDVSVLYTLTH